MTHALNRRLALAALAAFQLASAGCEITTTSTPADMAVAADLAAPPVKYTGVVTGFADSKPIADFDVCLTLPAVTPRPCTKTDASGAFSLSGIPSNAAIQLAFDKTGFVGADIPIETSDKDGMIRHSATRNGEAVLLAAAVGVNWGVGTSIVVAQTEDLAPPDGGGAGGLSGASYTLDPKSGDGPFYFAPGGMLPDKTATSTSDNGVGAWLNTTPGSCDLTIAPPSGRNCKVVYGWKSSAATKLKLTTVADRMTVVVFACQ